MSVKNRKRTDQRQGKINTKRRSATSSRRGRTRRDHKHKQKLEKQRSKRSKQRIFPIWLRIIVVLIGSVFMVISGIMIGYGVLGEGTPSDALKIETWKHIIDIVIKAE